MGLNGAFLTGDVFNLFVFFEVLLIASYGLMLHGAGARRITEGLKYVAINLAGSTLFLFAVGLIYAVTGTLNMADLAREGAAGARVRPGPAAARRGPAADRVRDQGGPGPAASLAARHLRRRLAAGGRLFAIMTKVGVYAILRVYVLIFGGGAGAAAWIADALHPAGRGGDPGRRHDRRARQPHR